MAEQWYFAQQGQRKGPTSEEQIRQLLSSGDIEPTDLVWKQGMTQWTQASQVFSPLPPDLNGPSPVPQKHPHSLVASPSSFWNPCREHSLFIGALLLFCFPVGLFLVWKHSLWTSKTKWIWTAAWIGVMLIGFIGVFMEERETAQNLAEANTLWGIGKKADAVDKYRVLLGKSYTYLRETDRPLVFRRVIEFDAEQGNADEAKTLIAKALDNNLALSLESPKAVAILTQVKDEKETKRKQAEEKKRLAKEADEERRLAKEKEETKRKRAEDERRLAKEAASLTQAEIDKLSLEEIRNRLGQPSEVYRSSIHSNTGLYIWETGSNDFAVLLFVETIDGSNQVIILNKFVHRSGSIVERLKRVVDKGGQ